METAVAVIPGQLGKNQDRYIAEQVSQRTRAVRQAIHVAQLCDSREEPGLSTDIASYFIHVGHHPLGNLLTAAKLPEAMVNL